MSIAYDSTSNSSSSTLSICYPLATTTWNHTCSGSNRYLFLLAPTDITTVTYNGVSMSVLTTVVQQAWNNPAIRVWGLANPTTGTNTISVYNSSGSARYHVAVASYTGVDSTQPDANNTNSNTSANITLHSAITTVTANSWIIGLVAGNQNGFGSHLDTSDLGIIRTPVTGGTSQEGTGGTPALMITDSNASKSVGYYTYNTSWDSYGGIQSVVTYAIKPYLVITLTGPASGNVNSASTNFTVTPDVAINGSVTITPSGGGLSTPIVLNFSNSSTPQTFTITPTDSGTVTLTLTNAVGFNNSAPLSYTANAVVPVAPTVGTATPLNASATVAFTDNSNGGSAITTHRAISTPGSFTGNSATSPITVTGLTNGVAYTFTVRATNGVGNSAESSASNSVTPFVPATSFTFTGPASGNVRSASTNFTVTPNSTYNGTITITPSGIGSTGLSPTVLTWASSSSAQTFTITPLNSGAITLTSTNSQGITNPSNLTYTANAIVPLAPTIGLAMPSISSASVAFTAPSNDGGDPITSYTVTSTPGGLTATAVVPGTVNILGLTNGTSYTFAVTATNSVGTSASSSASNAVIPTSSATSFTNSGPKFNIEKNVGNILSF